jgi:murein DD-endopeptidase MepM/ murein hydrolase activator NlpD
MTFNKKKGSGLGKYLIIIIILLLISIAGYIKLSPDFEQNKPKITIKDNIFWNLKRKLKLKLSDESGIRYYNVTFNDGTKNIVLDSKVLQKPAKTLNIELNPPTLDIFFKGKTGTITVQAFDNSKWNYLEGNSAKKTINVEIDKHRPVINILDNTLAIRHGGSAVAVVEIKDENLKDAYITLNNKLKFRLIPFHKKNYYVSLLTWPLDIVKFKQFTLVATDKANNISKLKIPFYIRKFKVKKDKIKITDKFIKDVSTNVLTLSDQDIPNDLTLRFIKQNENVRANNIKVIKDITNQFMDKKLVHNFNINIFRRLKGSRTAAGFGELRSYIHNKKKVDQQWHLGMDWASVKQAPIRVSNPGIVIFNKYLGIYGNTIIIDHGMGLATLYAHTSSSDINIGDKVIKNQKIANTGSSGAVLGDHLHFGVLIQGIEVNPVEWMDRSWIKTRILKILDNAKEIIDAKYTDKK